MKLLSKYYGIALLLFTLAVNLLFSYWPALAKSLYLEGFFQVLRYTYDLFLAWIPIPLIYIIILFLLLYLANGLFTIFNRGILASWKKALFALFNLICILISLFYWTWGFNYHIPNQQIIYNGKVEVSAEYLISETRIVQSKINTLRATIQDDSLALDDSQYDPLFQKEIRVKQKETLKTLKWPYNHHVNVRLIRPKGVLLRFSTSGIYLPHALEGHVDAGMSPLQYPATIAHEMAHGYGFTDEGFCNFIALLSCVSTDQAYIQYSALLNYYRYLMGDIRRLDTSLFKELRQNVHPGVRSDLDKIYRYQDLYPDLMPKVRDAIYDQYLKTHGVKSGLRSYSEMVRLVYEWKQSKYDIPTISEYFFFPE